MIKKTFLDWITLVLVIIGGLNWGLIGLFNLNLVSLIYGSVSWLMNLIYIVVGLSALYMIYFVTK